MAGKTDNRNYLLEIIPVDSAKTTKGENEKKAKIDLKDHR